LTLFSKEDKILIKNLYEYRPRGYNTRQFITKVFEQRLAKNSINRLLVKFGTVDMQAWASADAVRTDENVDTVESLLLSREDNLRTTEQSEKFHVRWGIHRPSVLQIIRLCVSSAARKGVLNR